MAVVIGLLVLASAFFSHSLNMVGAQGWTLLDLALPPTLCVCGFIGVVRGNLTPRLKQMSVLPLVLLFITSLHIFTDPRLDEILRQLSSTRVPTGGFRLYYSIAVSMLVYYTAPLIIHDEDKLRRFLRVYLFVIIFQIAQTYLRVALHIEHLPWDSYGSQIMEYDPNGFWGEGLRLVVLGDVGMHLFIFALAFMPRNTRWRLALMILGIISIISSKGRTPLLACILVSFIYLVWERRLWVPAFAMVSVIGAVLLFFAAFPSALEGLPATQKRYLSVFSSVNPEYEKDTFSRMEMWSIQWYVVQRNPFWGSMNDFPETSDEDAKSAVTHGDTHGVYLGIPALFGIPTLMVWLSLMLRQLLRSYDLWRKNDPDSPTHRLGMWLCLLLCAYLFKYVTSGGSGGGYNDFYVFLALIDVAHKVARRVPVQAPAAVRGPRLPAAQSVPQGQ